MSDAVLAVPAAAEVHQSRWGFHPCSKEIDRKLRFLNGVYQSALHKSGAWRRWERKAPHNRVARPRVRNAAGRVVGYGEPVPLGEPKLCPVFAEKVTRRVNWHPTLGYHADGIDLTEVVVSDRRIPEAARIARTPADSPGDVRPLPLSVEEIEELYATARG